MGVLEKIFRKQKAADEQAYYQEGSEEYKKALAAREARWAKGDQRTQEQHREDTRASIQRKLAEANKSQPKQQEKPQVQRQTGQPLKPKAQPKTKVVYMQPQPPIDFATIDSNLTKGIYNTSASVNNYNSRIAGYNNNFSANLNNFDKNLDAYEKRIRRMFG